ncbi:MAG TPA: Zn-ribbon domain-containing OB-fold protein [Proteobacteria bacterium]|nr:Zn-ribbon domain-containing OB-fold protein [Pseudomonadota bacterium]
MADKGNETRIVKDYWDLSAYSWTIEAEGLKLLTEGLKERKILGRRCHKCKTVYVPGQKFCRKCLVDIDEVVEVGQEGEVVTYTVGLADIRGEPLEEPIISVVVKLDGSDSWMMGILNDIDWKEVKVGMRVKLVLKEETKGELADIVGFVPA